MRDPKRQAHLTGFGMYTPFGRGVEVAVQAILSGRTATKHRDDWASVDGLFSHVGQTVEGLDLKKEIPRLKRRTMSKMSEMACAAAADALAHAGLTPTDLNTSRTIMILGSTSASAQAYQDVFRLHAETKSARGESATSVFKCMNSSVAINVGHFLDFKGGLISPAAACSTSSQAVVLGAHLIRSGYADVVVAGGADEAHVTTAISFDLVMAASRNFNQSPERASRPFDRDRDGIVVSEGASVVVMESDEHLRRRQAVSRGRVLGGSAYSDCSHLVHPSADAVAETIQRALEDARIHANDVRYVNAHATSTPDGDRAEAEAVARVFGSVAISSFKGHMGHSFAACGTSEIILSAELARRGRLGGTLNLDYVDERLPHLDFIREPREFKGGLILSNNFAFGGMNTAVVLDVPLSEETP